MQNDPSDNESIEISIFPFKFKHFDHLIELHKSNDYLQIHTLRMKNLPKIGYITYIGHQPIAAGFLRRVEGGYAQIDTLVSNKHFGSKIRHMGISHVVSSLISDAKLLKLDGIIGFVADYSTRSRAEAIGFKVLEEQRVIALKL